MQEGGRSKGLAERLCETPETRLQKRKGLMCIYGIIKLIVSSNEEKRKKIYIYSKRKEMFPCVTNYHARPSRVPSFFPLLGHFLFSKKQTKILCDDSAMLFVLSLSVL